MHASVQDNELDVSGGREKRKLNYTALFIKYYNSPCYCHCRFCTIGQKTYSNVTFDRVEAIVGRFIKWKNEKGLDDFALNFFSGPSNNMDVARLKKSFELSEKLGNSDPTDRWIWLNGISLRPEDELRDWLLERKQAGISMVGMTFIGAKELHDKWRGRKGDYDFEMTMARLVGELGIKRLERMFLTKSTLPHLSSLIDLLDDIPGLSQRWITNVYYQGWARNMESERITRDDLQRLPEKISRYVGNDELRTEGEWIEYLKTDLQIPDRVILGRYTRHPGDSQLHLTIDETNIEELESRSCDEIVGDLRRRKDFVAGLVPPLRELLNDYGDSANMRLYGLRELEAKWIDCFTRDHEQLIRSEGIFTDELSDLTTIP